MRFLTACFKGDKVTEEIKADPSSLSKAACAQFRSEARSIDTRSDILREVDLFVLDNSIRETTVAQLRGHTIEAKWAIYEEVKKLGFKDMIVASFSHAVSRVDDLFLQQLKDRGENTDRMWAFSEIQGPEPGKVPTGIERLDDYDLKNIIFEIDLGTSAAGFRDGTVTVKDVFKETEKWIKWTQEHLGTKRNKGKVLINFRDPIDTMLLHPERAYEMIHRFGTMAPRLRPIGLIFEEGSGTALPDQVMQWTRFFRDTMDSVNWKGHLLIHVHEKYGFSDHIQLEALKNGCDGIWAGACADGAALGHASSCNTIINLIRLGNTKVQKKYNCKYLRQAAIDVSKITTGVDPHNMKPIYGARAQDFIFSLSEDANIKFDMAEFFGIPRTIRITTVAAVEMYRQKLVQVFGENKIFSFGIASAMKDVVLDDLKNNRKEEYNSPAGLAVLFDRSGGKMTSSMCDVINEEKIASSHAQLLIDEIQKRWDAWDISEEGSADGMLKYDNFYNGFMAPYFACYRCSDSRKALAAIDMDENGFVDWKEFCVYLRWAVRQYPDICSADELLHKAFVLGIIPAMYDEIQLQRKKA